MNDKLTLSIFVRSVLSRLGIATKEIPIHYTNNKGIKEYSYRYLANSADSKELIIDVISDDSDTAQGLGYIQATPSKGITSLYEAVRALLPYSFNKEKLIMAMRHALTEIT